MKNIIMIIAGSAAFGCCVLSIMESQYAVAVLSLLSSFLPIAIWKWDAIENKKTEDVLRTEIEAHKTKLAELEENQTWEEI